MPINSKRDEHDANFAAALLDDESKTAEELALTEAPDGPPPVPAAEPPRESVFTPQMLEEIQRSRTEMLDHLFSSTKAQRASDKKLIGNYFSPGYQTSTATLEAPGSLKDKFEKLR